MIKGCSLTSCLNDINPLCARVYTEIMECDEIRRWRHVFGVTYFEVSMRYDQTHSNEVYPYISTL